MAKVAIKPNMFVNVSALKKVRDAEGVTDEEKSLYAMSVTSGWKTFKDLAERVSLELNGVNNEAIANGAPMEKIGENAVVISLAQDVIKRLLNKVDDAVEACEAGE